MDIPMNSVMDTPRPVGGRSMYEPSDHFLATGPRIKSMAEYEALYKQSIEAPHDFWTSEASNLHWFQPFSKTMEWSLPEVQWFSDGLTNLSFNCLDRHVLEGRGDKTCLVFERELEAPLKVSYKEMLDLTGTIANVLLEQGIKKGDTVMIYMPVCPENVATMQACVRIGAIHTVVFGGYSPSQIAIRADECGAKMIITADAIARRGGLTPLKKEVDAAIEIMTIEAPTVMTFDRGLLEFQKHSYDVDFETLAKDVSSVCPAVPLPAETPAFILYTSGSTGRPKGVLHTTGGYMVGAYTTCKYVLDLQPSDVYWCTADMGWITGHTYVTYGPLLMGATQVIYEGAFNYPDWDVLFQLMEKNQVSVLYSSPTLVRALMGAKAEPLGPKGDRLQGLRLLGMVGEPTNEEVWNWIHHSVGRGRCPIVDTWWQTETGGHMLTPIPGATPLRPGTATRPFFGVQPVILDGSGEECPRNVKGRLFIKQPWPSMLRGMYARTVEEFGAKYFGEYGMFFSGDSAIMDHHGYITIIGRYDDQLNVSGHRMGTAELESAMMSFEKIQKVAVIPRPDPITGQSIAAVVVLAQGYKVNELGNNPQLCQEIGTHMNTAFGRHGRPKTVFVVDCLPETKSGKTMRGLLTAIMDAVEDQSGGNLDDRLEDLEEKYSTIDKDAHNTQRPVLTLARSFSGDLK